MKKSVFRSVGEKNKRFHWRSLRQDSYKGKRPQTRVCGKNCIKSHRIGKQQRTQKMDAGDPKTELAVLEHVLKKPSEIEKIKQGGILAAMKKKMHCKCTHLSPKEGCTNLPFQLSHITDIDKARMVKVNIRIKVGYIYEEKEEQEG